MYNIDINIEFRESSRHKSVCKNCNKQIPKGELHVKTSMFAYSWVSEFTCKNCFDVLIKKLMFYMSNVDSTIARMRKS